MVNNKANANNAPRSESNNSNSKINHNKSYKKISFWTAVAVSLGAIIGSGIFVLSGTAIYLAGWSALAAFILVGILAIILALEIGELGSIMPNAKGAAYSFAYEAFGSELGFMTGILYYFSSVTAVSTIALGFGSYLSSMLNISSSVWSIAFAMILIFILAIINLSGLKKAANIDKWLVVAKIAALAIFVVFAVLLIFKSGKFPIQNFTAGHDGAGISAIFASSVIILFAYSGFQTISSFTSKVDGGPKNAAKAILMSVILSMIIYILVVFTMLLLMPPKFYGVSADPISLALKNVSAPSWLIYIIDIGALIATVSATLAMLIRSSRLMYQVSSDKLLPKIARSFNKQKDVAVNGTIISAVIGIVMLFAGNIYVIASISMFGILFAYLISSFSLIHFRRLKIYGEFKMPYYPYLTLIAISLILLFMFGIPKNVLSVSIISILLLFIVYYFLRESKEKKPVRVKLFK